jgi:hypothetical protein
MATTALFISEQYLRDFTPLAANLDIALIFPYCKSVQDTHIQDILGTSLYNTLQTKVINNNPSADEIVLLDLCRQALAWLTVAKALPYIAIQIRNIGVQSSTTDNGSSAELEKLKYVRHEADTTAQFYQKRLTDYLCFNGNLYPDYVHFDATKMMPRMTTPYDCDLSLGGYDNGPFNSHQDLREFWKLYVR